MCSKVSEKICPPLRTLLCLLKSSSSFKDDLQSHSRKFSRWVPILVIGALGEVQVPVTLSPRFQCGGDGGVFVVVFATPSGSPLTQPSVLQLNSVLMLSCRGAWSERRHQSPQVKGSVLQDYPLLPLIFYFPPFHPSRKYSFRTWIQDFLNLKSELYSLHLPSSLSCLTDC